MKNEIILKWTARASLRLNFRDEKIECILRAQSITHNFLNVTTKTNELIELLTPLIPRLTENMCSLRKFYDNHNDLLQKVRKSGRPLVLLKGSVPVALILNPQSYIMLEKRRQNVAKILSRLPEEPISEQIWPSVGRRQINTLYGIINKIEQLKSKIGRYGEMLKPIVELQQKAEKELDELEKQKAKQLNKLKPNP